MEISCTLHLTLVKEPLYGKNPVKKVHLLGSFSIWKDLLAQETELVLHYYKSSMPLKNKVHIIDPNFGTLGL